MVEKITGPRESKKLPVRFAPDSPEQIEESTKYLHPQLDKVFKEAIDRAKKKQ